MIVAAFNRCLVSLAFVTCLPVITSSAWAGTDRADVGSVQRVQNQAHAIWDGDSRQLAQDAPIIFEDMLTTGADSRLQVTLLDGSDMTLSENASVTVDKVIYDPDNGRRIVWMHRGAGAFLLAVSAFTSGDENEVIIDTQSVTIGIRGTTVWAGDIDGGYGVFSLEGLVLVTTAAEEILLQTGEGVTVTDPTSPVPVLSWGGAKIARALATVQFEN